MPQDERGGPQSGVPVTQRPADDVDLIFQVITAIIIGGTSLFGGSGTIAGSALGAILFAEINNGLQVINVDPLYQDIFIGVILVAAIALDQYRRQRRFRLSR